MSIQKLKKGFTLIELMVVIVIIGILAAIAIPKLFGMTAKAKAQEIPPAASTWLKLQQAAVAELGQYGGNQKIAYVFPGAPNAGENLPYTARSGFEYNVDGVDLNETTKDEITWSAKANALGDCTSDGAVTWSLKMDELGDDASYITAAIGKSAGGNDPLPDCDALTPRFKELDTRKTPDP
jgi:prepilin-type N-terminal cleavage/methylation domain-containing protein